MIPIETLLFRQALPLEIKIQYTKKRIKEWYKKWHGKIYIAFSGGKDSTVLLHIARSIDKNIPAVFCNSGLEFPEIVEFVKNTDNVTFLKPKLTFKQIIDKWGYPIISKENSQKIYQIRNTKSKNLLNKRLYGDEKGYGKLPKKWYKMIDAPFKISDHCCNIIKKYPSKNYEKESGNKPIIGTMCSDSSLRKQVYMRFGCNIWNGKRPRSCPISFWTEKDIWDYIHKFNVPYSKIYDMGYKNTGCMFCLFGVHRKNGNRKIKLMKKTHPKLYEYCLNKLNLKLPLDYLNIDYR